MITFVSATRLDFRRFVEESWLGRSFRVAAGEEEHQLYLQHENVRGLPEVYNAAIDVAHAEDVLVFVHDDVFLSDRHFTERLLRGLDRFDVVGLAGCVCRAPGQTAWISSDGKKNDPPENLSGKVAHPRGAEGMVEVYGETPREVKILDGVLLAARAGRLQEVGARFDPRFKFHLYDLDFCRTCEAAGLRMGTWPIAVVHASAGTYGSAAWREGADIYLGKWETDGNADQHAAAGVELLRPSRRS